MADMPVFQFNPEPIPQQRVGASGASNALGVSGGVAGVGVVMPDTRSHEGDFNNGVQLPEFIAKIVEPKLQAQRQQKFFEGFAAARAGATRDEINNEVPWFKSIFGETPYEQGATVFFAQKASADMEMEFMKHLPELRKLPPEEIGRQLNEITQASLTGDLYSDAVITKEIMTRAGPMLQEHGKARYEWQQSELARGQFDAVTSAGAAFHSYMVGQAQQGGGKPLSPEASAEATRNFLATLISPELQAPESYARTLTTAVDTLADQGNWYAVKAIRESGVLRQLDPDEQEKLDARLTRASARFQANLAVGDLAKPLGLLRAGAGTGRLSGAEVLQRIQHINDQYAALTGDDTQPFFDADESAALIDQASSATLRMWERNLDRNDRAREKAEDALAKERAEAETQATYAKAVATNRLGEITLLPNADKNEADRALLTAIAVNPARAAEFIVGNFASSRMPFVSEPLAARLRQQVELSAGEEYTDGFNGAYQEWRRLRYHEMERPDGGKDRLSGAAAAARYYGPEINAKMQQFDDMLRAQVPPEFAYRRTFGNEASFGAGNLWSGNPEETKQARKDIESVVDSINPRLWEFGRDDLGSSAHNLLLHSAARHYTTIARNNPEYSTKEKAEAAILAAKANGLEIAGSYAWQNMRGQRSLQQYVGMPDEAFEDHFEQSLTARFRAQGVSIGRKSSVQIIRLGDDTRGPRLIAMAQVDGKMTTITITGDDLKKLRVKAAEADRAPARSIHPRDPQGNLIIR